MPDDLSQRWHTFWHGTPDGPRPANGPLLLLIVAVALLVRFMPIADPPQPCQLPGAATTVRHGQAQVIGTSTHTAEIRNGICTEVTR